MYLLALKVSRGTIFHIRKYGTSRYLLKDSKVTLICLPGLPQFLFILFGPLKIISLFFFRVYCLIGFCFYWSPIKRHHFTPLQLTCCTPFIIVGILKTEHDYCCVSFYFLEVSSTAKALVPHGLPTPPPLYYHWDFKNSNLIVIRVSFYSF